jgi:Tol biopolymer transport system component
MLLASSFETTFSSDSSRLAYVADGLVYVDGRRVDPIDGWTARGVCFSPDSTRVAYAMYREVSKGRDALWRVAVDQQMSPDYDALGADSEGNPWVVFSADGRHVFYTARRGAKWCVVKDHEPVAEHDYPCGRVVVSPDGTRLAYVGTRDGKSFVIVDGREGPEHDQITTRPRFSPDSRRIAYVARKGLSAYVVVDGVDGRGHSSVEGLPVFSPDSAHVAYVAYNLSSPGYTVYLNGQPQGRFTTAGEPHFSSDSRHLTHCARTMGGMRVILDGQPVGPQFTDLYAGPVFRPDGSIECIGTGRGTFRVTLSGAALAPRPDR